MKPFYTIIVAVIFITAVFVARLGYLQLITDKYVLNAANTSVKIEYIIPQRGIIFDRNSKILVGNQPTYEISYTKASMKLHPETRRPIFDTLGFCDLVGISQKEFEERIKKVENKRYFSKFNPTTFIKDLTKEEIARIKELIFKYPAFSIVSRPQRKYEVSTSGNLLGYTNQVSDTYIRRDSSYYLPGDIAGMSGIEKAYEKELRGEKGIRYIQKDIKMKNVGPYKDGRLDKEEVSGKDLVLTIDYDLQRIAQEMLANKRGAIVALDPKSGEILAMATGPDIDPNLFTGPNKTKNLYHLQMDSMNRPMFDRSIQAAYPPGSTFKLVTALAGMQMGIMNSNTIFPCERGFNLSGVRIKGHGGADSLIPSLKVSSNCYFSHAYLAMLNKYPKNPNRGIDEWAKIMHSFGLGIFLNNDLAVGSKGLIPDSKFYERRYGKNWKPINAVFNGMGQGEILITPLQIANFTAAIANKGWYYTPHIVKSIDGKPNPDERFRIKRHTAVDPKYFDNVLKGMEAVVLQGTGRGLKSNDFTQLAKTGTAEVPQGKDNSIYTMIAPAEDPKIVVAAVMEHAGFGATWAGPACTIIAEKYLLGEIKRERLYKKLVSASFMPEYDRQWVAHLKKIGKYVPTKQDSIQIKKLQDSLKVLNNKNKRTNIKSPNR